MNTLFKPADFKNAEWISSKGKYKSPLFRKKFTVTDIKSATVLIGCFGMFEAYINGEPISDCFFGTPNTDFHSRPKIDYCGIPFNEELGHRLYCPEYDVTPLIREGENVLSFITGSGWYESEHNTGFGYVKLAFLLTVTHSNGNKTIICSNENTKTRKSFITDYSVITGETQNFNLYPYGFKLSGYNDLDWENSYTEPAPYTEYFICECPPDKIIRKITPTLIFENSEKRIYDVGEIITGFPVIISSGGKSEKIVCRYSELISENGELNENNVYGQNSVFITDGKAREMHTMFTWFCFRYFEVTANCNIGDCLVVHSDVEINSHFKSDNEILNWYYTAFIRSQLANMHCGVPSDCPHIERKGYTGDGQLLCNAAMTYLDAEEFYKKWIYDISDCQDRKTGHVQYTAPFYPCGGGPGGWGCAIVNVPYEYYRHYRNITVLSELYPQMLKYFEYLDAHSENELIVSDRENVWCLGEWCTPEQTVLNEFDGVKIPKPYVNTYFYIKSLKQVCEIAELLNKTTDVPLLKEKIKIKSLALCREYYNPETGNFCDNVQGANAFAVDLGLGDKRTLINTAEHYEKLGHFDTGIFGTDIVTRILFENGYGDIAVKLLTSKNSVSFYNEMQLGATTLLECWNGTRSHCHPMFGAASVYLAEFILGIRMPRNLTGTDIIISPVITDAVKSASGYVTTMYGKICIDYNETTATVTLPANINAKIDIPGKVLKIIKI